MTCADAVAVVILGVTTCAAPISSVGNARSLPPGTSYIGEDNCLLTILDKCDLYSSWCSVNGARTAYSRQALAHVTPRCAFSSAGLLANPISCPLMLLMHRPTFGVLHSAVIQSTTAHMHVVNKRECPCDGNSELTRGRSYRRFSLFTSSNSSSSALTTLDKKGMAASSDSLSDPSSSGASFL